MSILQRNNKTGRIAGMKECKMTKEKSKENGEFIHKHNEKDSPMCEAQFLSLRDCSCDGEHLR